MNKIEQIRAEIERHKELFKEACDAGSYYARSRRDEANEILSFIDSLPSETSVDLEKAAKNYTDSSEWLIGENLEHIEAAYIAGANWQKEKDERIYRDFYDARNQGDASFLDLLAYREGHRDGMDEQKEQMMKEAVCGIVHHYESVHWIVTDQGELSVRLKQFRQDEKVRLVIIKED